MINPELQLSIRRQAELLAIGRSTMYYRPRPISDADLMLMWRMGIEALYRRPNASKPAPGQKFYPYLLRGLPVTRPNQV